MSSIEQRNSLVYLSSDQITYMISYTPFNEFVDESAENYIDLYVYTANSNLENVMDNSNNPFGSL